MKTNLTIDVDEHARFVIAKFFAVAASAGIDKTRTRATRAQVRRFVNAAVRTAIKDAERDLRPRSRAAARRLADPSQRTREMLPEPRDQQRNIQW